MLFLAFDRGCTRSRLISLIIVCRNLLTQCLSPAVWFCDCGISVTCFHWNRNRAVTQVFLSEFFIKMSVKSIICSQDELESEDVGYVAVLVNVWVTFFHSSRGTNVINNINVCEPTCAIPGPSPECDHAAIINVIKGDIDNIQPAPPLISKLMSPQVVASSLHNLHFTVAWSESHVKWWIFRGRVMNSFLTNSDYVHSCRARWSDETVS